VRLNIIGNIISIFRKLDLLNEFETLVTLRSLLRVKKSLMEVGKISDKLQKKINEENQPDETKEKAQQSRDQSSDQSLDEINKLQDDILKIIEKKEKTRTLEIRRMLKDVTSRTIRRNLKPMLKRGQIKKLLEGRRVYYVINK
jgi:predicted HTH transcriptional regulator